MQPRTPFWRPAAIRRLAIAGLLLLLALTPTRGWTDEPRRLDRSLVPEPVCESEPGFVDLYWKAWELAFDHVLSQPGIPQSPYMDEGLWPDTIWIWDTCFMGLFCRYSPGQFPGIESLRNFYAPAYGGFPLPMPLITQHPDNPPLFAWVERDYFQLSGDRAHIKQLLEDQQFLQKHYDWFAGLHRGQRVPWARVPVALQPQPLGFQWSGIASGMDNSPRFANDPLAVDALAQQGLAAHCIAELAGRIGDQLLAARWTTEFERVRTLVNRHYWDERDGFYYDLAPDGKTLSKTRTPAGFWPVFAGMATPQQVARMAAHIRDPADLGGTVPWVTLSRSDPAFNAANGDYWRGAVWLPTAYMGVRALAENGQPALADSTAEAVLRHMLATYRNYSPHTIWECYNPNQAEPAFHGSERVRADFCGWSALGPISLFIENVLGFHGIDAERKVVQWRLHQSGACGLRRLRFGPVRTDIVADGKGGIEVEASEPYTLIVNGQTFQVRVGSQRFAAPLRSPYDDGDRS